jgi:F-type H+-transporting ATPase subunit b
MLEINPGLIVWTIITFLIVLVILRAAAWKPLLAMLTAREEAIRTSLTQAEQARQEAQKLLDENTRRMAQAEEQSQRILAEGRALSERMRAEIVEKANASARSMLEQAKEEIGREKEKALSALRNEVADLAVRAAGKIIDANLDTARHRALVDAVINDIRKS